MDIEKLPFYAVIGVPEAWVVDRDTREPRVLVLEGGLYRQAAPGADGWTSSPVTGIALRARDGKLEVRAGGDDATAERLPED